MNYKTGEMENASTEKSNKYLVRTADINTFSHRILTINIMQFVTPPFIEGEL